MIRIICVGKIKEEYLNIAIKDYLARINKYYRIEIIEILDEGKLDEISSLNKESEKILEKISDGYNILLDREGKLIDSMEFANVIDKAFISNSSINFIIGGSYGVNNLVKEKVDLKISFSKLTFPHQLFRVILLEQIYRGCKINNNEKYHK